MSYIHTTWGPGKQQRPLDLKLRCNPCQTPPPTHMQPLQYQILQNPLNSKHSITQSLHTGHRAWITHHKHIRVLGIYLKTSSDDLFMKAPKRSNKAL